MFKKIVITFVHSINGVPACANEKLLTDILRKEWNFTGYVVSDESAIENIIVDHHYFNNSVDTVAACVNAGCNLELSPNLPVPVYFSLRKWPNILHMLPRRPCIYVSVCLHTAESASLKKAAACPYKTAFCIPLC